MTDSNDDAGFKQKLKTMILEATGKEMPPGGIPDDAPLFGGGTVLDLDSLDGLQISMAIQREYGVRIADSKELRRVLQSIDTLAEHLRPS